jgi:homocysteine S-methyltransferase
MDSHAFREALAHGEPLLLDGGLATQLEAQGADITDALWSARLLADDPDAIVAAHRAFFAAGARVAITASYQASFDGFARRGIDRAGTEALLRRSVALARRAADGAVAAREAVGRLFVAASVGPYGALLADGSEYRGRYGLDVAALGAIHRDRLRVLAGTDADVLAVETIPELEEAVAIVGLLGEIPGTAAWVSFTCADGERLRGGARIEDAVVAIADAPGVVATGVNCTAPRHVEELIGRIRSVTGLPVVVYPNSGEGWDAAARRWTGGVEGRVDGHAAARWRAAGATLVGGCCRVRPDQVAAMRAAVEGAAA